MHEELAELSVRARCLEQAIAEVQNTISNAPHPLLVRDSQIRTASPVPGLQRTPDNAAVDSRQADTDELLGLDAALRSLHLDGNPYHGDTVASEVSLKNCFPSIQPSKICLALDCCNVYTVLMVSLN